MVAPLANLIDIAPDTLPGAMTVIVDQTFADVMAPGANVIGRRIRLFRQGQDGAPD
ncbi:MAG TPA: hypothetical protein VL484_04560 [Vicinamibacterales bacterium]|jgi:hypothetical protein|nr:hypothetical protein [Vicinamibacterales bacterium]